MADGSTRVIVDGLWSMATDGWFMYWSNLSKKKFFSAYWLQSNREMDPKWVKMNFLEFGVNRKVVYNVENYLNMKFQTKIFTRSRENGQKPHFLTYFLIWLPSIWKNHHTIFRKVVDNDRMNISGKFEASILKTFWINGQKLSKTLKNGYF